MALNRSTKKKLQVYTVVLCLKLQVRVAKFSQQPRYCGCEVHLLAEQVPLLAVSSSPIFSISLWFLNRQGTALCSCLVHCVLPALGLFKCMSPVLILIIKPWKIFASFCAFLTLLHQKIFFIM